MKQWVEYDFDVNGFQIHTVYNNQTIQEVFFPLLQKMTALWEQKKGRILVYLAAPPATGKTTLCQFLEYLSRNTEGVHDIQSIGLDGFHYHADYIKTHTAVVKGKEIPMKEVKGCPETYDIDRLTEKLRRMRTEDVLWPVYSRALHDVIEDQVTVNGDIILIEGNWLLLKDEKWRDLKQLCDYSIMIRGDEQLLKERLIERKMKGGSTEQEAAYFYEHSDGVNVRRTMQDSQPADLFLILEADGDYQAMSECE